MQQVSNTLLLVATTLVVSNAYAMPACAQRLEEVLSGNWKLDSKKSIEVGGEQARQILSLFTQLDIEFRRDGTVGVIAGAGDEPKKQTGTWKVFKIEGKSFGLQLNTGSSGHKDLFRATLLEAGDYLQLSTDKNQPLQFVFILARVKPN